MRVNKTKGRPSKAGRFEQQLAARTYEELVNDVMPSRKRRRMIAAIERRKKPKGRPI